MHVKFAFPCDACEGRGEVMEDSAAVLGIPGGVVPQECPACIDMPWLKCKHGQTKPHRRVTNTALQDEYAEPVWESCPGKFKPDPSCVLKWCKTHDAPWHPSPDAVACWKFLYGFRADWIKVVWARQPGEKCDVVWVERPTALEVIDGTSV